MNRFNRLSVVLIQPSRYDDDGYVIRYFRGVLPSNTLACLRSLTLEFADLWKAERGVTVTVDAFDEVVEHIPIKKLARRNRRGTKVVAALVGVQSNQFMRASDMAKELTSHGIKTLIGGFHVSGVISMFGEPTPEIRDLMGSGVTVVHGEAENQWESILSDVLEGKEKSLYVMEGFPDISEAPFPAPDGRYMKKFALPFMGTVDCSRGCPFNCSFCTVVNVQGRKMRHRSAETILAAVENNYVNGIHEYFFTDDNFARNPEWERILDGIARLREKKGMNITIMMQVDTRCHKIPGFIEKAARAGCSQVFIGMESINPKNIEAAGKKQNKVEDYAEFIEAWHSEGVATHVGYIIGFPFDTPESVRGDINRLKNEIKVDQASFFMLTPLPGSRDHLEMVMSGRRMDPDLNKFDSFHVVMDHPLMTKDEWLATYNEAWESFYSFDNLRDILMRCGSKYYWGIFKNFMWYRNSLLEPRHPMVAGFVRLKNRHDVRPGTPVPGFWAFHAGRIKGLWSGFRRRISLFFELQELWLLTRKPEDPTFRFVADMASAVNEAKRRMSSARQGQAQTTHNEEVEASVRDLRERLSNHVEPSTLRGRSKKRVRALLDDMNAYLEKVNLRGQYHEGVTHLSAYLTKKKESIENCSLKFVGRRRKVTAYWMLALERMRKGKFIRILVSSPKLAVNALRDVRMSLYFLYHLLNRNIIRHK